MHGSHGSLTAVCLKEIPRPFARTVELAVVRFQFSSGRLGDLELVRINSPLKSC